MTRLFRFIPVALLTFAVGVSATFIGRLTSYALRTDRFVARSPSASEVNIDNNPEITVPVDKEVLDYCELVRDPERFNGKTIRFSGNLGFNRHGLLISGRRCESQSGYAAVLFYPPTRSETFRVLAEASGSRADLADFAPLDIIATAKFYQVKPAFYSDMNIDTAELQIELIHIESAKRVP